MNAEPKLSKSNTSADEEMKKAEEKKVYMREYMREWKKKKYAENPEKYLRANRSRYLAKTGKADVTQKARYGDFLHSVKTATELLMELSKCRPDLVKEVLKNAGITMTIEYDDEMSKLDDFDIPELKEEM
jgi:hypothetical protein